MIVVTGATGHVGSVVVRELHARREAVVAMVRDAGKARSRLPESIPLRVADYDDEPSLSAALAGAERMVLVPSDGDARDVLRQHARLTQAARQSGVKYIVLVGIVDVGSTSPFYFAPVYRDLERRLREADLPHAVLRCNLFAEFVIERYLRPATVCGRLRVPLGQERVAPVSRADVSLAAAKLARQPGYHGRALHLNGVATFDGHALASLASHAWSRPVDYAPDAPAEYLKSLWEDHSDPWPHAFSTLAASIAQGRYAHDDSAIGDLLGRTPETLSAVLSRTRL